jgi:hypothetical protein
MLVIKYYYRVLQIVFNQTLICWTNIAMTGVLVLTRPKQKLKMNHVTHRANSILQNPSPIRACIDSGPRPPFGHALTYAFHPFRHTLT